VSRERVRGTYDPLEGRLELAGTSVDDPILVATDEYRIVLDRDGAAFAGRSHGNSDAWGSQLRARAVR
jgi:hypothetical protein